MRCHRTLLKLCILALCVPCQAQLVINEIMQSNIDCIMDDMNEFPDSWVELCNTGTNDIDLGNYQISVSDLAESAWQLPSITVHPSEFLVVYCDKTAVGLHTDFRLESGKGGCVYLYENKKLIDKVEDLKKQPAPNISYGREKDGSTKWGYMLSATPGQSNNRTGIVEKDRILGDPMFSEKGQVYATEAGEVILELSKPAGSPAEAYIVYTDDGSEPSVNNGKVYINSININKTKIIKAKLICEGWLSPRAIVNSYIFHGRDVSLPVISLSTDGRYINDSQIGILVEGDYQEDKPNYRFDWRRPVQIEFFEKENETSVVNQLCEFRVAGSSTRILPLKTMNVYAHKRFGTKRFSYIFFPDQKPEISEFKSLVLRNSGSRDEFYSAYVRDALVQRTMGQNADLDYQAYRPAIIYLNGQYKGVINIRERTDEDFVFSNYNGLEDVDVIENNKKVVNGSVDAFNTFKAFYEQPGHSLDEYDEWMDCSEFLNLVAMNLYFCNIDFLGNNNIMWRAHDNGKWRWIAKDCGYSVGSSGKLLSYDYNIFRWLYENEAYDSNYWGANSEEATLLFRHLMEDKAFYNEFIDRICIYSGDFLNERGTRVFLDVMYDNIKEELPYHKLMYMPEKATSYEQAVSLMNEDFESIKKWLHARSDIFFKQMGDYYNLGDAIPLKIYTNNESESSILFNGIKTHYSNFDGFFFPGRMIHIEVGKENQNEEITGWNIVMTDNAGVTHEETKEGSTLEIEMPKCNSLTINPLYNATDISSPQDNNYGIEVNGCLLTLYNVSNNVDVVIYTVNGLIVKGAKRVNNVYSLIIPNKGIYFVRVGNDVKKVLIN